MDEVLKKAEDILLKVDGAEKILEVEITNPKESKLLCKIIVAIIVFSFILISLLGIKVCATDPKAGK